MRKTIEGQIKKITQVFTYHNISVASNFPQWQNNDLVWEKYQNLSFALKNEKYPLIYENCLKSGDYNLVLMDGAIIQMKYKFFREEITEHVLTFYPSPFMERFQDNPEEFMATYYNGDKLFSEIMGGENTCSPLRFDFNSSESIFKEIDHPKSHLTIGEYKNCRIPLTSPLSPFRFMKFIMRNFYFDTHEEKLKDKFFNCDLRFLETALISEKKHLHFNWSA